MKKRLLAMLLTLSMLVSMLVIGVSAENAVDVNTTDTTETQEANAIALVTRTTASLP